MKILFIVWNFYPNTAYTNHTKATVKGMYECGCQVDVLSLKPTSIVEQSCITGQSTENSQSDEPVMQDSLKLHMMEEFISRMSRNNTKLIMIASPKFGAVSSDVFAPVKRMCERYGNEFWDYYCAPEFQHMDFFKESMHLNSKGANVFSTEIANRIIQIPIVQK